MLEPQLHFDLDRWLALAEADLARFEGRLRRRAPRFRAGDTVSFFGDRYRVRAFPAGAESGYELARLGSGLGPSPLFLPLDLEPLLLPFALDPCLPSSGLEA